MDKEFLISYLQKRNYLSTNLLGFINELAKLNPPQSSQITLSIDAIFFANFAFFAVKILCYPDGSVDTNLNGIKIHASAKANELTLLETANTLLIETLRRGTLPHTLKSVVSATPAPHGGV